MLTTIANAQKDGKIVCFVNGEKPIDRNRFEFFGINLEEMLYIEAPENAELALEGLRTLTKEKIVDVFVIDSTNSLCPKSVQETNTGGERGLDKKNVASLPLTLSNFYNIVNAHVFRSKAAVIWIGQTRTKGIGSFFAHQGLTGGSAQAILRIPNYLFKKRAIVE
jgi:RecA/RadA recombinase